jgi:oxaloacetate decarboxylase alpha subunit
MAQVLGDEEPITGRFADTLEPMFEKTKEELKGVARSDEDVLSYIAFPQIAEKFFKEREERENVTVNYSIVKK